MDSDTRWLVYNRAGGICESCGQPVPPDRFECAHRIANTKSNRRRWGPEVIDHPLNLACTHSRRCNDAQNIGFKPDLCRELAERIRLELDKQPELL